MRGQRTSVELRSILVGTVAALAVATSATVGATQDQGVVYEISSPGHFARLPRGPRNETERAATFLFCIVDAAASYESDLREAIGALSAELGPSVHFGWVVLTDANRDVLRHLAPEDMESVDVRVRPRIVGIQDRGGGARKRYHWRYTAVSPQTLRGFISNMLGYSIGGFAQSQAELAAEGRARAEKNRILSDRVRRLVQARDGAAAAAELQRHKLDVLAGSGGEGR